MEHHVAVGAEKDSINLEGIIQDISELIKIIKTKSSDEKPSTAHYWPSSPFFSALNEILSEGADAALATKDIISSSEGMKVVKHLLIGLGQAHWAATGLLVVANILERFEMVGANRDECLSLLEEMSNFGYYVKNLKKRPGMESSIRNATEMVLEGALMCCTQISSSKFSRFFSTSVDKEKLAEFQKKLQKMYRCMDNEMFICILDAVECSNVRLPVKERERPYPKYAVGIEKQVEEVTELLEWESKKETVAVMVHGFGGKGKTTLADAVFARLYIEGCKYSMVRLFKDINSSPDIVELQKCILKDLMLGSREEEQRSVLENIRTFEDGQLAIGRMLEKEVAFIYIDNVLEQDFLENLLPRDMENAKRCRLLITARDMEMRKGCSMDKVKFYDVKYLPDTEAMNLLKKEINSELLSSDQLKQIVKLCGGIPKLLYVLARYIRFEEDDEQNAFHLLMEDQKKWNLQIEGIDGYLFTYERLPERVKDPFLDICSFFNGYDWDEVRGIVGDSNIDVLEKRGLVNKDKNMKVTVHDVILKIGSQKSEGTRIIFKSRYEIENFLNKDLQGIKGISFNEINDTFLISARKLDSMSDSLRILALGSYGNVEGTCDKFFEKLVYFQGKVPYLQFDVSQSKELRCLKCQPQDLNFLKKMPPNLKHVELDGSLQYGDAFESSSSESSSSDRQQHHGLRTLRLFHFEGLKKLPEELGDLLKFLQELNISYCASIEELPASMSKLQSLRKLMLFGCISLKSLPENLGSLSSLQTLDLKYCDSIVAVRGPVSNLQSLRELCISDCPSLKSLPKDLGSLRSLQKLDLSFCQSIEELPSSIWMLQSLRELSLFNCSSLKSLPEYIGYLSSLQSLYLSDCKSMQELPPSFSKLQSLRQFVLENCLNLQRLPEDFGHLSSLQELDLGFCTYIQELPGSFSMLQSLRGLKLTHCSYLMSLPEDLGRLSSLQTLDLSDCKALQELPESFSKLPSLTKLLIPDHLMRKLSDNFREWACRMQVRVEMSRKDVQMSRGITYK